MMRGGNATIGTWLQFPSADVAEVMGASGYDWVAVDMEHGAFTRAILPDVFRAIERGGSTPFARIAQAELRPIKDALDSGAQGLVFPMIESREQLDRAISLSLYPDAGRISSSSRRSSISAPWISSTPSCPTPASTQSWSARMTFPARWASPGSSITPISSP